jgi:type I restriction enzyme, S subunit
MGSEWSDQALGGICTHSAFGPRFSSKEYSDTGNITCLRPKDIFTDGRFNFSTMPLADLDGSQFTSHFLKRNDLVLTRTVG